MGKMKVLLYLGVVMISIALLYFRVSPIISVVLVVGGFSYINSIMSHSQQKKRLTLLNTNLDPDAFLEATEKLIKGANKKDNRTRAMFTIDMAAGYIAAGELEKALESLNGINKKHLSEKNNTILIYHINRILCLYKMYRTREAEELYAEEFEGRTTNNNHIKQGLDRVACEHYFFLKDYEAFKATADEIINSPEPLSLRSKYDIEYRIAQVAEIDGDFDKAKGFYEKIAEFGNKLWIAEKSRQWLEKHI